MDINDSMMECNGNLANCYKICNQNLMDFDDSWIASDFQLLASDFQLLASDVQICISVLQDLQGAPLAHTFSMAFRVLMERTPS
jgi:hypothetical protein